MLLNNFLQTSKNCNKILIHEKNELKNENSIDHQSLIQ